MKVKNKTISILNEYFPKLVQFIEAIPNFSFLHFFKSLNFRFSNIVNKNLWGSEESVSGVGSILDQTETIRKEIPILIKDMNIKSLLDVPCGDFNWLSQTNLDVEYTGCDIVPDLITINRNKYQDKNKTFKCMDITKNIPSKVDLILCRDCLVHLSYKDIFSALKNFKKSKSKFLLTTTFTNRTKNRNIFSGGWRPLNLELSPFNLPKPVKIINENCTEANGKFLDKSLGLWYLESILI
ncbi:MAG: class I SAM-dependent methyltransferase [Promethearchaeota archaeon]